MDNYLYLEVQNEFRCFKKAVYRGSSEVSSGKLSYAEHKEQQKKIRKAEKAVKECETKIEKLETRKAEIDALLMKPENATNMELVTEYTELMKSLDEENENWMMLSEELEEVKNS